MNEEGFENLLCESADSYPSGYVGDGMLFNLAAKGMFFNFTYLKRSI